MFFVEKLGLETVLHCFPSELPTFRHISEVGFDHKCIKFIDTRIFIMEKFTTFTIFSVKQHKNQENRIKMGI